MPTQSVATSLGGNSQKKVLVLGDSYTIGQSVFESDRFPNKMISLLTTAGINLKYSSQIIARTGWTTQNLLSELAVSENV